MRSAPVNSKANKVKSKDATQISSLFAFNKYFHTSLQLSLTLS